MRNQTNHMALNPALIGTNLVSFNDIKPNLVGLDGWLRAAAASDAQYDLAAMKARFPLCVRSLERDLQFRINQIQIVGNSDGTYAPANVVTGQIAPDGLHEVKVETGYTYFQDDAGNFYHIRLFERPVQNVQRFRFMWNKQTLIYQPDPSWFNFEFKTGDLYLIPYTGTGFTGGAAVAFSQLSLIFGASPQIPAIQFIDYIAGLPDSWQDTLEWSDLWMIVTMRCSIKVLEDISELFDSGRIRKQVEYMGFRENLDYDRFMRRKEELTKDCMRKERVFQDQNTPVAGVVV